VGFINPAVSFMLPNFLNMLSWWQWLILAAVPPAIVLLYFLKLKRRPIEVPSTYLWRKSTEDLHVNSIWQRLRRNLLLFLQLLIIALAVFALLRPSWQGTKLIGNRFIFLVDNSASMSATDVKPTRLDEAKRQVGELIDQMRSGDAAMLISFCDSARVEQSFTDNRQQLREALKAIQPTARATSLLEALKLAAGLANPGRSAEGFSDVRVAEAMPASLYIFSDGRFGPVAGFALGNLEAKFIPIGSPDARNIGITAFSVRRNETKPDRLQAFARLENFGPETVKVPLRLFRGGEVIDANDVEVSPKEGRGVNFDFNAAGSAILELKADTDDQLALDDVAYAVINPPRRSHVLLVSTGNEPLRLALRTKEAAEIADVQIELPSFLKTKAYKDQAAAGGWQLAIFDRCRPERMPAANTLFIGDLPPEGGWSAGAKTGSPQIIDVETAHPLLQWIDLGDVLIGEATPLRVPRGGRVLVDSDAGPLMALAPRDAFQDVVLGFVIVDETAEPGGATKRFMGTNWMIRPSFPVFVLNLLDCLGGSGDGLEGGTIRPGTPISLESAVAVEIRTPTGRTVEVPARLGKAVLSDTSELGVYEVRSGGKTVRRFAVNLFDPAESTIRADVSPAIRIGDIKVKGETSWEAGRREIWKYLALAGLAVLLLEWYIYVRRIY
jgi:hypothetical protein